MKPRSAPGLAWLLAVLTAAVLAGCATPPFSEQVMARANRTVTPAQASREADHQKGLEVLWGGTIAASRNLADSTELTVVAYPLGYSARPDLDAPSSGRFVLRWAGYLEPVDFAPGRTVTVYGLIDGTQASRVGEHSYVNPVVDARQVYLWPISYSRPSVYLGVGVGVISH